MTKPLRFDKVLHIGNLAFTSTHLVTAARSQGLTWHIVELESASTKRNRASRLVDTALRGARFESRLLHSRMRSRGVHLHSALALKHVGWALGDYALHLHGTDIRTRQYEARHAETIRRAVGDARVVFYPTPDVRHHTHRLRPDATLVPIPVAAAGPKDVPHRTSEPYIFFPSRWEQVKGGQLQIDTARLLVDALGRDFHLIGLDWGPLAPEARDVGVTLVPKMPHSEFRRMIAGSAACVGQTSGILATSELDSLALGVPLVSGLNPEWYDGSDPALRDVPVVGGTALGGQPHATDIADVVIALARGEVPAPERTGDWIAKHHSPEAALRRVLTGYADSGWLAD